MRRIAHIVLTWNAGKWIYDDGCTPGECFNDHPDWYIDGDYGKVFVHAEADSEDEIRMDLDAYIYVRVLSFEEFMDWMIGVWPFDGDSTYPDGYFAVRKRPFSIGDGKEKDINDMTRCQVGKMEYYLDFDLKETRPPGGMPLEPCAVL